MDRIKLLTSDTAPEGSKETLKDIQEKNGKVINIFKAMANSPAALKTYFAINKALGEKVLDNANAERIAIRLAILNGCEYCNAAHSYLAKAVLSEDEIKSAREGKSSDAKAQAVLDFTQAVMQKAGRVSDDEFEKAKNAGLSDNEIMDIVAVVALNFFTNAVNNVAQTRVDFPKP